MSNVPKGKNIYFLYARKSSESEERQVQSIEDQISRIKDLARNLNLEIKEIFTEAKSAKKPYIRPVFTEMLKRIEKGEANGILTWQVNRLFRNPVDYGTISWMLQQGIIKTIQTIDRQYFPEDVLLLSVEAGMANQYIVDLRKNSRRGMEGKAERGWMPGIPPIGYQNDKLEKKIVVDKERFDLVRKMWDMMISGEYTPRQIRNIANIQWGFRTPIHKSYGNKELSNSLIYKMFSSIFYTGTFEWSGKLYNGNHKPMISLAEYDCVQELLGRKGRPRAKTHSFAYTGLIQCAECGCMYTATEKKKLVKTTGALKLYLYYHCTKKNVNFPHYPKPIPLANLETQIEKEVEKYTILPEFFEWAIETLSSGQLKKENDKLTISKSTLTSIAETEKELLNLTRMRYKELIDEDAFIKESTILKNAVLRLKNNLQESDIQKSQQVIELTKKTFHFAAYARKKLTQGTVEEKRGVLFNLGSNCYVKDEKLNIEAFDWFVPIEKQYPSLEAEFKRIELDKSISNERRNELLLSLRQRWLATVEDVRTEILLKKDLSGHMPK